MDHEAVPLPAKVGFGELHEFRDTESGVEVGPDGEFFLLRLACSGHAVGLVPGQVRGSSLYWRGIGNWRGVECYQTHV